MPSSPPPPRPLPFCRSIPSPGPRSWWPTAIWTLRHPARRSHAARRRRPHLERPHLSLCEPGAAAAQPEPLQHGKPSNSADCPCGQHCGNSLARRPRNRARSKSWCRSICLPSRSSNPACARSMATSSATTLSSLTSPWRGLGLGRSAVELRRAGLRAHLQRKYRRSSPSPADPRRRAAQRWLSGRPTWTTTRSTTT